jgi:hypothetical protein
VLGGADSVEGLLSERCNVSLLHVAGGQAAVSADLEQQMRQLATSTGAACDVVVDDDDLSATNPLGTDHTVDVTVTDNVGGPPEEPADVRFQVFRGPSGVSDAEVTYPLEEEAVVTTDADGNAAFTYTGPDSETRDYIVACTDSPSGDAVDTCVDPVAGQDVLLVAAGEPLNVRDDVAAGVAIKDWVATAGEPGAGANLLQVEFCDDPDVLQLNPCEPYEAFGDQEGDFLRLTFDGPLAALPADAEPAASVTLTSGAGQEVFRGDQFVAFVTANEFGSTTLPGAVGQVVEDLNDNQLLIVIDEIVEAPPVVPNALDERVVDLAGINDADGVPVVIPDGGAGIARFETELPLP